MHAGAILELLCERALLSLHAVRSQAEAKITESAEQ